MPIRHAILRERGPLLRLRARRLAVGQSARCWSERTLLVSASTHLDSAHRATRRRTYHPDLGIALWWQAVVRNVEMSCEKSGEEEAVVIFFRHPNCKCKAMTRVENLRPLYWWNPKLRQWRKQLALSCKTDIQRQLSKQWRQRLDRHGVGAARPPAPLVHDAGMPCGGTSGDPPDRFASGRGGNAAAAGATCAPTFYEDAEAQSKKLTRLDISQPDSAEPRRA